MTDQLISLQCRNCGGTLKLEEKKAKVLFKQQKKGTLIFVGGRDGSEEYKCEHCGAKFVKDFTKVDGTLPGSGNTTVTSIIIGGPVRGSNIVVGNGNVVNGSMADEDDDE